MTVLMQRLSYPTYPIRYLRIHKMYSFYSKTVLYKPLGCRSLVPLSMRSQVPTPKWVLFHTTFDLCDDVAEISGRVLVRLRPCKGSRIHLLLLKSLTILDLADYFEHLVLRYIQGSAKRSADFVKQQPGRARQ